MSSRNYALKGEARDAAGKGVARQLRREEKVPGVVYGDAKTPVTFSLPAKETRLEYLKGHMFTSLCNLTIGGEEHLVLARDIQLHPVTDRVQHIDFLRVTPKTKLHVQIPLHVTNEDKAPGLTADKGVLHIATHELDVICQATDIPDHIDVDLTGLNLGDSLHIADIKLPAGSSASPADLKKNIMIASISAPKRLVEEAPAAAEGDAAAAPAAAAPATGAKAPAAAAAAAPAKKK